VEGTGRGEGSEGSVSGWTRQTHVSATENREVVEHLSRALDWSRHSTAKQDPSRKREGVSDERVCVSEVCV
jgi:hypothetical protein